jgi:PAS domain S-box-containing protein
MEERADSAFAPRRWLSSLHGQLIVLLLLASVGPVLLVAFFPKIGLYSQSRATLESTIGDHLREVAEDVLSRCNTAALQQHHRVAAFAHALEPHLREMLRRDPQELATAWRSTGNALETAPQIRALFAATMPQGAQFVAADIRGLILASDNPDHVLDVVDETWWRYVTQQGRPYVGKAAYDEHVGAVFVPMALPVKDDDRVLGVVQVVVPAPEIPGIARLASAATDGDDHRRERDVVLLGRDAADDAVYVVAHSRDSWQRLRDGDRLWLEVEGHPAFNGVATVATDSAPWPDIGVFRAAGRTPADLALEVSQALAGKPGIARPPRVRLSVKKGFTLYSLAAQRAMSRTWPAAPAYTVERDADDLERVYAFARSASPFPWAVVVSQPTRVAFTPAQALQHRVLWMVAILMALLVVASVLFARRLMRPVRDITDAVQAIRRGNLQQTVPVSVRNEIGILAREFNAMTRTVRDVLTRLTHEERKLSSVLNSVAEGIVYLDLSRRIVLTNPAAEFLLGVAGDVSGKAVDDVLDPALIEQVFGWAPLRPVARRTVAQEVAVTVEGQAVTLKVVSSPVLDEDGTPMGVVYVLDDITREKDIEKMKSDFVALVSHELRTPLTSIIGYMHLVLDGKTGAITDVTRDKLERVERQALRLAHLIGDLLDLSRIESGHLEMHMEPVSLEAIALQRLEEIRPQADEKGIRLDFDTPAGLPQAMADGERIGQVVTNLLSNAVKFTPEGGVVRVRLRREGNLLSVQVLDTGPGIPRDEQQKVFDKFHQVSSVHTRQQGGSGLGLAIAKSIVEAHGGHIWVDSELDRGTDFRFVLPVAGGRRTLAGGHPMAGPMPSSVHTRTR